MKLRLPFGMLSAKTLRANINETLPVCLIKEKGGKENAMAKNTLESNAHELLGQLNPGNVAAEVHLLEVMVHDNDSEESDTLSAAEASAIAEADEWSKHNKPIPHEQVLAEFGLSKTQWKKMSREP